MKIFTILNLAIIFMLAIIFILFSAGFVIHLINYALKIIMEDYDNEKTDE